VFFPYFKIVGPQNKLFIHNKKVISVKALSNSQRKNNRKYISGRVAGNQVKIRSRAQHYKSLFLPVCIEINHSYYAQRSFTSGNASKIRPPQANHLRLGHHLRLTFSPNVQMKD